MADDLHGCRLQDSSLLHLTPAGRGGPRCGTTTTTTTTDTTSNPTASRARICCGPPRRGALPRWLLESGSSSRGPRPPTTGVGLRRSGPSGTLRRPWVERGRRGRSRTGAGGDRVPAAAPSRRPGAGRGEEGTAGPAGPPLSGPGSRPGRRSQSYRWGRDPREFGRPAAAAAVARAAAAAVAAAAVARAAAAAVAAAAVVAAAVVAAAVGSDVTWQASRLQTKELADVTTSRRRVRR